MALTHSFTFTGTKTISGDGFFFELETEVAVTKPLYVKVASITGNKQFVTASVVFVNQLSGKTISFKEYKYVMDLEGPNPIKQAYLHLKSLPEFADAMDC